MNLPVCAIVPLSRGGAAARPPTWHLHPHAVRAEAVSALDKGEGRCGRAGKGAGGFWRAAAAGLGWACGCFGDPRAASRMQAAADCHQLLAWPDGAKLITPSTLQTAHGINAHRSAQLLKACDAQLHLRQGLRAAPSPL